MVLIISDNAALIPLFFSFGVITYRSLFSSRRRDLSEIQPAGAGCRTTVFRHRSEKSGNHFFFLFFCLFFSQTADIACTYLLMGVVTLTCRPATAATDLAEKRSANAATSLLLNPCWGAGGESALFVCKC